MCSSTPVINLISKLTQLSVLRQNSGPCRLLMQEMASRLSMCKETKPSRTHRLQTEATLPDNSLEQPKMYQTVHICLAETGMAKHPCNLKKQLWACAGVEELDQALGSSRDSKHLSDLCKASFGNFAPTLQTE